MTEDETQRILELAALKANWLYALQHNPNRSIYNHQFAQALWGSQYVGSSRQLPNWQWHLKRMVTADDPIKYLEENLNDQA